MTSLEAEIFIRALLGENGCMDVGEAKRRYRNKTLTEALEEQVGKAAQYIDLVQIEKEILSERDK